MQLIAYFSNGPLQGQYKKVRDYRYRYPLVRRMTINYQSVDANLAYYEYMRQLPPLFEDSETVIFEFKIEDWRV